MQTSPGSQRGAIHPPVRENAIPKRPAMRPPVRRPGSMDGVVRVAKSDIPEVVPPAPVAAPEPEPFVLPMPPTGPIADIVKLNASAVPAPAPAASATPETPAASVAPAKPGLNLDLPADSKPAPQQTSFGSNTPVYRNKWLLVAIVSIIVIIIGVITFSIL